ncbi:MAG: Ig-like domain-containing protein, partial [Myxococcota bacterium]
MRTLIAALALAPMLAFSATALAGNQMVPTPPLVGDGATPAVLHLLAPAGTKIKVLPDRGTIQTIVPTQGGHRITYVPPVVGEHTTVAMTIRIRGAGVKEDLRVELPLVPSWAGTFSITADPGTVAKGKTATIKVRPSSPGPLEGERRLKIAVSEGEISGLVPSGDGTWAARYTAPSRLEHPVRPVFVVVDTAAPVSFVDAEVLPVTVTRNISLTAAPDSTNILRVGDREYGPTKASPDGSVSFDVDLHPDRPQGTLTSSVAGTPTVTTPALPMTIPPSIVIAPLPTKAGGGTTLPVPIACRTTKGRPCVPSDVSISVTEGTTGDVQARGELLMVPWTLPDTGSPSLTVKIGDKVATAGVGIVPSPNTLTLSSDPANLTGDVTDAKITARAKDPAGKGVTGRIPGFDVRNGRLIKRTADNRDGTYTTTWRLNSDAGWLEAVAWPKLTATGLAPQRLVAWPVVDAVNADGSTQISLIVVAEDAVGMPVPDVSLELAVPQGDGALAPSAKTDKDGLARITYKVGIEAGLVEINVAGAGLSTTTRLWQSSAEQPYPGLLAVGSTPDLEAVDRWKARVAHLFISKAAAPVVVAAPVTSPGSTSPSVGTPGTPAVVATNPGTAPVGTPGAGIGGSPGGKPARAPKASSAGSGAYRQVRLRGAFVNGPFSYRSRAVGDADISGEYAPEASFATSAAFGHFGVQGDAEAWVLGSRA